MLTTRLTRFLRQLRKDSSGNAMMLVALGMPALIGTAGMGVDMSQFYLWKREIQYAADQAALAGAWSRANGDTGVIYQTRAEQEFSANQSVTTTFTRTFNADLATYNSVNNSSVLVTASVTNSLPFTQIMINTSSTIAVRAQATWETTQDWTACLYALDPHASSALYFHGGPNANAPCGVGAMSDAEDAVEVSGNAGTYNVGWVVTGGEVDDQHNKFSNASVNENLTGMTDPFDDLTPPDNAEPQELSCGAPATTTWTADETRTDAMSYTWFKGNTAGNAKNNPTPTYTGPGRSTAGNKAPVTTYGNTYTSLPANYTGATSYGDLYWIAGSGKDTYWERAGTTPSYTYNITEYPQDATTAGAQQPGTYSDFDIHCDTILAGGIYVIDGGDLNVNANYSLTGEGVMFVLKNGAGLVFNGGAEISLTPMDATQLMAAGVDEEDAVKLAGMLIFEDPASTGASGNKINGDAQTDLNGVIYMPKSHLEISGGAMATSECLMVASKTLTIAGGADLTTLCPSGEVSEIVVAQGGIRVRLVA